MQKAAHRDVKALPVQCASAQSGAAAKANTNSYWRAQLLRVVPTRTVRNRMQFFTHCATCHSKRDPYF